MCVKVQNWQGTTTMVIEEGVPLFLGVCVQLIVGESKDWFYTWVSNSKQLGTIVINMKSKFELSSSLL